MAGWKAGGMTRVNASAAPGVHPHRMPIRWRSSLSVGIDSIDEQHKELIRRAAAFLRGLADRSRQDVGALLSYLRIYAVAHFGEEEEAMRASEYPGYERHKAQHDRFLRDLLALSKEQEKKHGAGVEPGQVGAWIEAWLGEHVSRTDAEMARYLVSRSSAGSPPAG